VQIGDILKNVQTWQLGNVTAIVSRWNFNPFDEDTIFQSSPDRKPLVPVRSHPPPAPLSSELLGSIWRDGGSPSPSQLSVPRPKSSPGFLQSTQRAAKCPNSAKGSWKWISNGKADQSAPSRLSRHLNAPPPPAQRNLAVPNSLLRVAKSAFLIHGGLYLWNKNSSPGESFYFGISPK
jgi:hypothetical protein